MFGNACEFDGKMSLSPFRGTYLLYVRANLKENGGGRFVQVAQSIADDPGSAYSPFTLLSIAGYDPLGPANIYFAAVKPNPLDEDRSLLGLFAVNFGDARDPNRDGDAFVALALSCDGVAWSPLVAIRRSTGVLGRTYDQPVDGFVVRSGRVFLYLHLHVPGISPVSAHRSRLVRHELRLDTLTELTRAAHQTLPACAAQTAGVRDRLHMHPVGGGGGV
jgi:hypothetical protein